MTKTETPSQYDRRQRAKQAKIVRQQIDAAGIPANAELHPTVVASIADDAMTEGAHTKALVVLAQIPPFRVGRATYRVLAEKTRQISLICKTQPSTLWQHGTMCSCHLCVALRNVSGTVQDVWYHDSTRTYHVREPVDGTFTMISRAVTDAIMGIL